MSVTGAVWLSMLAQQKSTIEQFASKLSATNARRVETFKRGAVNVGDPWVVD
jgi:hypothetical protein